jgi:hypothetical protein
MNSDLESAAEEWIVLAAEEADAVDWFEIEILCSSSVSMIEGGTGKNEQQKERTKTKTKALKKTNM